MGTKATSVNRVKVVQRDIDRIAALIERHHATIRELPRLYTDDEIKEWDVLHGQLCTLAQRCQDLRVRVQYGFETWDPFSPCEQLDQALMHFVRSARTHKELKFAFKAARKLFEWRGENPRVFGVTRVAGELLQKWEQIGAGLVAAAREAAESTTA
jgi:hypothetical protein